MSPRCDRRLRGSKPLSSAAYMNMNMNVPLPLSDLSILETETLRTRVTPHTSCTHESHDTQSPPVFTPLSKGLRGGGPQCPHRPVTNMTQTQALKGYWKGDATDGRDDSPHVIALSTTDRRDSPHVIGLSTDLKYTKTPRAPTHPGSPACTA